MATLQDEEQRRHSIEMRAYQLWEERGRPWGSPEADWFAAEQELESHSDSAESPAVAAAKLVGSVFGSVAGVFNTIVETVQTELHS